jgi:hypothetical protein
VSEAFDRLAELVEQLQVLMRERLNKREPFLSSFADLLKNVVDKTREWFNEEVNLAEKEVGILEELVPLEDFSSDRSKLMQIMREFNETAQKLDDIVKSVKNGDIKTLKDLAEGGGLLTPVTPEFITEISKLYTTSQELEDLIESLEQRARYLTYPFHLMQAMARRGS